MQEVWRDVKNYEGKYQVSNTGYVRKLNKDKRSPFSHILKANDNNNAGYFKVWLSKDGKSKICSVHRLVAETFIDNPQNKPMVNHIDCNKKNNHVKNLEWVTASENSVHALENGRLDFIRNSQKRVKQMTLDGEIIAIWDSFHEIERVKGFSASAICKSIRHGSKKSYGFLWGYADE